MLNLVALVTLHALSTPAPIPREFPPDPDEAIAQFERETGEVSTMSVAALREKQKRLLHYLDEMRKSCVRKGQNVRAEAVRERKALLEASWRGTATDRGVTVKGLEAAMVRGKYRTLLRTLHMPGDRLPYSDFNDFGAYQPTDYAGFSDLPAGYWVYVFPCWYLWRERPGR